MKPLVKIEAEARQAYQAAQEQAHAQRVTLEAQISGVKERIKKAAKGEMPRTETRPQRCSNPSSISNRLCRPP